MFAVPLHTLIATHGLWAVFAIVALESAGLPLPGETALVSAAVFAGANGGLPIGQVIGVAILGAILGDNIGYFVGRRCGLPLARRYGGWIGLDERRLGLGRLLFERHGGKILFFGRFVAFLRIFAAFLAGVNGLSWGRFLFFNATGACVWAAAYGLGGYYFGDAVARLSGPLGVLAFVAAVTGIVGFWWVARRQEERYFQKLEREAGAKTANSPDSQP